VAAEEQQRLLVAELNHRVRNMLQVVIGLSSQTLRRSSNLEEYEGSFMGRMQALARAYELLSRDGWHSVPIAELLRSQLAPFTGGEGRRYTAQGDDVVLVASAALSIGLVVYELATNATKYGALSVPGGHVDISWQFIGSNGGKPHLVLQWNEHGGPPVKQPTRHGFGSELVQRQLRYELNGQASLDYAESGLRVTMTIPASDAIQLARPTPTA
jgi:two-component system CheB/CheR fusion protein